MFHPLVIYCVYLQNNSKNYSGFYMLIKYTEASI